MRQRMVRRDRRRQNENASPVCPQDSRFMFQGRTGRLPGSNLNAKIPLAQAKGCALQHVVRPLEFKIRGTHDDTMPHEEVVTRLRAKFHRGAHPRAGAVCAVSSVPHALQEPRA